MGGVIDLSYEQGGWRRICDQCGTLRLRSDLHRKLQYVFCSDCDAPGDRIQEEEDAAIARMEPFLILPVPYAKPNVLDSPYDWQEEEAQIFNFITATAPSLTVGGISSAFAAAWAAVYMADIVNEGTRPAVWVSTAKTVIDRCLTFLLTQQYGAPTGTATTADNPRYGGILVSGSFSTAITVAAGLAFVSSYSATGNVEYLNAANRCATFVRHAQCGDLQVTAFTVYPSGGGAYHIGGLAGNVSNATGLLSSDYSVANVFALTFLEALADVVGTTVRYGDAAATSFFSAATAASLSDMISQLVTFAVTGPKDSAHSGNPTPGLSTTAPKVTYAAALDGTGGPATWNSATTVDGNGTALALRGLFDSVGLSTFVLSIVDWLRAFTPNAANATPSTNTPQQTLNAITGTYDPMLAIADTLTASAPFTEATGALYSWSSTGAMSPVLAAAYVASLKTSISTVSTGQPYSTFYLDLKYLGPLGLSGLSLQPKTSATASTQNVVRAAQAGNIYRQLGAF